MSTPRIIFGAGGIGGTTNSFTNTWNTPEKTKELLGVLSKLRINELDSAASYPPGNPWHTETLLGEAGAAAQGFIINSKVAAHEGNILNDATIPASVDKSLSLLGLRNLHILHAHLIDKETHLEVTAAAFHQSYMAGKFEQLGLCNFPAEDLAEYFRICDEKGYVKPAVYQGHYNALVRGDEKDLIPLLRKHGAAYHAFSPLGGGFLTGKVTFAANPDTDLARTRWTGETKMDYYPKHFDRPVVHEAFRRLHEVCQQHQVPVSEVCLRWVVHHSALGKDDAIILGASKVHQLEGNVADCRKSPLPQELLTAVENMWKEVSSTMVNTEVWR